MSKDYIPGSDNDFQAWAQSFDDYVSAHVAELGLDPADIIPIIRNPMLFSIFTGLGLAGGCFLTWYMPKRKGSSDSNNGFFLR